MLIWVDLSGLKESKWQEVAVRFAAGGLVTAAAGAIAKAFGPSVGGIFLAFPAILTATITLVAKHEREKKRDKGLNGERRGVAAAGLDALGGALGSLGLVAFAITVRTLLARRPPVLVLAAGTAVWCLVAFSAWLVRHFRRRFR